MSDYPIIMPIVAALFTLLALFALVLGFGPVFDWLTIYILSAGPNPYADAWFLLAKFFYALITGVAIVSIIWVWQTVIARVRYRREIR